MTNHPNRGWRKRWTVERVSRTAVHASGLTVRFQTSATRPETHDQIVLEGADKLPQGADVGRLVQEAIMLWRDEER